MNKEITYPQYRKYSNNKSYFKIISSDEFEEIQLLGTKKSLHLFKAKILPDRNYVNDMLTDFHLYWDKISEEEFAQFLSSNNL